ncbi:MAG TPA: hypothetical protein VE224_04485 [Pseudolabrys sp.]|nr:hypothetical protein [Pseudolabrys sp.]
MSRIVCRLAMLLVCAAGVLPVTAQAQWLTERDGQRPPPLYPYEVQPGQSYAVEVAPGTYVIHHQADGRDYRTVTRQRARRYEPVARPRRTDVDRRLVEELRRRDARRARWTAQRAAKRAAEQAAFRGPHRDADESRRKPDEIIHTRRIVRDKPVVIVHRRVVEDPPRVITRRHYVDNLPRPRPRRQAAGAVRRAPGNEYPRVIHADAEITILGPDRMSIRLIRKDGQALDARGRISKRK